MSTDIRMAWRNIWRSRRRTILALSAIAFSCLVLIFMISFQAGAYGAMIDSAVKIHVAHLQVQAKGYSDTTEIRRVVKDPAAVVDVIDGLDGLDGLKAHTLRSRTFSLVSSQEWTC